MTESNTPPASIANANALNDSEKALIADLVQRFGKPDEGAFDTYMTNVPAFDQPVESTHADTLSDGEKRLVSNVARLFSKPDESVSDADLANGPSYDQLVKSLPDS